MNKDMVKNFIYCIGLLLAAQVDGQNKTKPTDGVYQLDTSQVNTLNIFMEALKERSINNNENAYALYKLCVEKDPTNGAAYFELAQLAVILKDYPMAISSSKKAYELDKNNKFYREFYLEILSRSGNPKEALDIMETMVKDPKASDQIKMQYVDLLIQDNQLKKALSTLNQYEKVAGYSDILSMGKVKIFEAQKDTKSAETELKKMIQNNPGNSDYMKYLAEFYLQSGDAPKADVVFNDILRIEPNNPDALIYKTQYYSQTGDMVKYRSVLKQLIDSKDLTFETKLTLITDKVSKKNGLDSSDKIFLFQIANSLINQYPEDFRSYQVMGDMSYIYKEYDQALSSYKKSLSLSKTDFNVWLNLFYTLNAQGNYKELADSTKSSLEYFPASSIVYFYNGLANNQLKNYSEAEKSFNKGLRFVGENKELEAMIYSSLGDVYFHEKKYTESDESFESAIKLDPNNAYTLNNYAYYLSLRKDKLEQAKKMSKKSLDIDENNASFLDTYAWINFQLGDFTTAKYYQEKAIKSEKEDLSTIYDHYGDIMIKINQPNEAIIYWKKAKDAKSTNPVLDQKINTKTYIKNPND